MAVVICLRPAQDQARKKLLHRRRRDSQGSALVKLLAVGGSWESEGHSLGGMVAGRLPILQ